MTAELSADDGTLPLRPRRPPSLRLAELARELDALDPVGAPGRPPLSPPDAEVVVTGITQSSGDVQAGDLYVARPGGRAHGADHAVAAVAAGATAALTDAAGAHRCRAAGLATLVAGDPGAVAGPLGHFLYGHPADAMTMIGITGTNGKTTTTFFIEAALGALGRRPGLIGTIMTRFSAADGSVTTRYAARTTPEATELAGTLATMREAGCTAVVMEVSSHALSLGRVDGIRFDCAGFLNLAEDHLDLHGDMEHYFAAKASLFTGARTRTAVVDVDTDWGRRLADATPIPVVRLSIDPVHAGESDVTVSDVEVAADGTLHAVLTGTDGVAVAVRVAMPGLHNLADAAMAIAVVGAVGGDPGTAALAIADARVPGRMERFALPNGAAAYVDFAHTPEAITSALTALVRAPGGRVIAVAGCGGDRDPGKRGPMGAALARNADVVIVTDDNPRSEDPSTIRAAAVAGARAAATAAEIVEIGDRAAAIRAGLDRARSSDVVIVLGKGHEQGQDVGGVVHPFDDREQIRQWLGCR